MASTSIRGGDDVRPAVGSSSPSSQQPNDISWRNNTGRSPVLRCATFERYTPYLDSRLARIPVTSQSQSQFSPPDDQTILDAERIEEAKRFLDLERASHQVYLAEKHLAQCKLEESLLGIPIYREEVEKAKQRLADVESNVSAYRADFEIASERVTQSEVKIGKWSAVVDGGLGTGANVGEAAGQGAVMGMCSIAHRNSDVPVEASLQDPTPKTPVAPQKVNDSFRLHPELHFTEAYLEELKVRQWKETAQRALLSQNYLPKAEDMPALDDIFTLLESYDTMTPQVLRFSKISKLMRHIHALPAYKVPRDDEFRFRARAETLVRVWAKIRTSTK